MEYDVFISYARKDYLDENKVIIPNNPVSRIIDAFDNNKISYWIDEKGIYSGDAFAKLIANSIKKCAIFLFLSSKHSNESDWTIGEVATAREYKKKIIPLRLDSSEYNDGIILYLASLDYIVYDENSDKAINKVVEAVIEYRDELHKKKLEEERLRKEEEKKIREKEEQEWLRKQHEIQQKEQERLEAIEIARTKKEEELNAVYSQLNDLDIETSKWEEEILKLDEERKKIEHQLSLIEKQKKNLDTKRGFLEAVLSQKKDPDPNTTPDEPVINSKIEPTHKVSRKVALLKFRSLFSKRFLLVICVFVILVVILIICNKRCSNEPAELDIDTLIDSPIDSISQSRFVKIPQEKDSVYGIETVGKINNWNDLHVKFEASDTLHKVSFAFLKVLTGISDANYIPESEQNRRKALKAGIRVGLYQTLNIKPQQKYATGKAHAEKYYKYVQKLSTNELPPVILIPALEQGNVDCAIERCNEWIDEIRRIYNLRPIVSIRSADYNKFLKGKLHDCTLTLWLNNTSENTNQSKFVRLFQKKVLYYNDTIPYETVAQNWRLSVFSGTYKEFLNFKE